MAPSRFRRIFFGIVVVFALVGAACSGDDTNSGERGLSGAQPAPTLAGQAIDGFAPGVDDQVAIIGIAAGETLPMRVLPGEDQALIAEIPSTTSNLFGFGQAFETPDGQLWWLVRYNDAQGWIQPGAAYLGAGEDISVGVAGRLQNTSYDSMQALVADVQSQFDGSIIVSASAENTAGDLTATLDALDDSDDALAGQRIIVTASADAGSYRLTAAQSVPLCTRGVTSGGVCQ